MKTILTMVLVAFIATTGFGTDAAMQAAKKNLNEKIGLVLHKDVNESGNYFQENGINKIKEDLKVSFYVNEDRELVLLRVNTGNTDAKAYMKHFFKYNNVKADKILIGRSYSMNLHLRYNAR